MGFDASEYNRWGMDQGLGTTSFYAVSPYAVYLYTIANDMVDVNDTDANRVVSIQRITVGDGYAQYSDRKSVV